MILNFDQHFYEVPAGSTIYAEKSVIIIRGAFGIPYERSDIETRTVVLTVDMPRSAQTLGEQIAEGLELGVTAMSITQTKEWDAECPFGYKVESYS